jgi:hypothetical protein
MSNELMDKIRQQQEALEARQAAIGGTSFGARLPFWKPSDGANRVRLLPAWTVDPESTFANQFWRETGQHWNVAPDQRGPVLCPQITEGMNEECPICDFCDSLKADKSDLGKIGLYKEIRAKRAYFVALIDLDDPEYTAKDVAEFKGDECPYEAGDPKVQVYACPVTVWNGIVGMMASTGKNITHLTEGRDLIITKIPNRQDRFKTKYQVNAEFDPTDTPVPADFTTPSLENVGWEMSYSDMLKLLTEGKGGDFVALLPNASVEALPEASGAEVSDEDTSSVDLREQMKAQLNA